MGGKEAVTALRKLPEEAEKILGKHGAFARVNLMNPPLSLPFPRCDLSLSHTHCCHLPWDLHLSLANGDAMLCALQGQKLSEPLVYIYIFKRLFV